MFRIYGTHKEDKRPFDLTYSEEDGWSDPDDAVLSMVRRSVYLNFIRPIMIPVYPPRLGKYEIEATLNGEEDLVLKTITEGFRKRWVTDYKIDWPDRPKIDY